jgi:hypothetical protein
LTTAFHSIASIGLYEKRLLATAAIPALLGVLLIGFVFGEWWQLGGYSWYFLPGTPLPQDPAVIYAATLYNPLAAVLLVGLATATASFLDYCTVKKLLDVDKLDPIKQASFFRTAVRGFYWRHWLTIAVFSFTPLPFFPLRILALSSNYLVLLYVSANLAGRLPRYYLLTIGGAWLPIPLIYLVLIGFAISLAPCVVMMWLRRKPALAVEHSA